ncbi:MAG: DUF222 domain-containing protein [Acidimicrobiales bacterium]|nr:DUF222 domain-containing protein [Acidimicrobiales bacterium]RZV45380.1 MAG: DUF222 domain-containing protein [Acidimicrobiales bacterium]
MGDIGPKLIEVGWRANDNQSQVVHLAAAFADSHEWAAAGYSTPGRWIADTLEIARRTANEWIRVARCLRDLPATAAALEERRISFTKAKELTRSATPENERELLAITELTPANELGRAIAAWLQRHEPDAIIDARHARARSLRWQTEADGMVTFTARLPPAMAGALTASVDAEVMRHAQAPRESDSEWPSLAQQRADALVEVLSGGGTGIQTELILHVRGDGATLDDGTPITTTSVAGMIEGAFIRALIHDADARPINASSKRRHPTDRQRRVVKERDRVCIDCGGTGLLQYDHVPDYAESQHTVVEELELRCAVCHRFRHSQEG